MEWNPLLVNIDNCSVQAGKSTNNNEGARSVGRNSGFTFLNGGKVLPILPPVARIPSAGE